MTSFYPHAALKLVRRLVWCGAGALAGNATAHWPELSPLLPRNASYTTATSADRLADRNRSFSFGKIAKPDKNLFTTTKSICHTKLTEHKAEAVVVVAVVGSVVVAIGNAAVPRVVVPAAAAQQAVGAFRFCRKNTIRRSPLVYALETNDSNGVICS